MGEGPLTSMAFPPWSPSDLKDVREEALRTPTAGCQACKGDQVPARRVGRPRKLTPACVQRLSDLKKTRLEAGALPAPPPAAPAAVQPAAAASSEEVPAAEPPRSEAASTPVQPGPGAPSAKAAAARQASQSRRRGLASEDQGPPRRVRWDLWGQESPAGVSRLQQSGGKPGSSFGSARGEERRTRLGGE